MMFEDSMGEERQALGRPGEEVRSRADLKKAGAGRQTIEIRQSILNRNDQVALRLREAFHGQGVLVLNVLSSPGAGKTTFLGETIRRLQGRLAAGVIVGDLATDNDARRLRETGAPVVQITTGTMCHLEAKMIQRACGDLQFTGPGLMIIENVGNLVCPAAYYLGEDLRVVMISVTEGEDKPLKYPPAFQSADVVIVSKTDLLGACGIQREELLGNIRKVAPGATVLEVSARTGEGLEAWTQLLVTKHQELLTRHHPAV